MRKVLFSLALAGAAMTAAGSAMAHGTAWSVTIGTGGFGVAVPAPVYAPPVYAAPVYAPPVAYVPRVYAPPPMYAAPVAYAPPVVYAPRVIAAPVVVGPPAYYGYRGGHRPHHFHGPRW